MKLSAIFVHGVSGFIFLFTTACSKDLKATKFKVSASDLNALAKQASLSKDSSAARFDFHFKNFYTLTNPQSETACAGDLKTYYKPEAISASSADYYGPVAYDTNLAFGSETIRPAFIKNISVDLTDANAPSTLNLASSCAYSPLNNGVPTSNCATFDYGAVGGVPTNLGGTILLFGGTTGTSYQTYPDDYYSSPTTLASNYHGTTVSCGPSKSSLISYPDETTLCNSNLYTLNIDSLPASIATTGGNTLVPGLSSASEPISAWGNLSTASDYVGPSATAGGSIAYNQETSQVVLFGGSKVVTNQGPTGAGVDTNETWVYDLKKEKWNKIETQAASTSKIVNQLGFTLSNTGSVWSSSTNPAILLQQSKIPGPRALFGYAAVPKMSLKNLSYGTTGTTGGDVDFASVGATPTAGNAGLDATDRIIVLGGLNAAGVGRDTYKLNPTFGPELMDTLGRGAPVTTANFANKLAQWADSFPSQPLFNLGYGTFDGTTYAVSDFSSLLFNPNFADTATLTAADRAYSFGFAPLLLGDGTDSFGSLLVAAGFDYNIATHATTTYGGKLSYLGRYGSAAAAVKSSANFLGVPSDLLSTSDTVGSSTSSNSGNLAPAAWRSVTDAAAGGDDAVPWYGGGNLLPGFFPEENEYVFFGGTTCRQFLTDSTLVGSCNFANPQKYWRFDAAGTFAGLGNSAAAPTFAADVAVPITPVNAPVPSRAGMAAARGRDGSDKTVIVAWGGMTDAATLASDNYIYILYNNGDTDPPTPTWLTLTSTTTGETPSNAANAQMVYSHVTGKYYLYGGLRSVNGSFKSSGETWELTLAGTAAAITATWKRLDTAGGMTCYPECPSVRRSHRMTEVNYNNLDPTLNHPVCTNADTPCSFGIFMEGGTSDGYTLLSDRWMFDPTANGGVGHWQRVDTFPPRKLAAMTSISYTVPSLQKKVNRTLLFGGETAFHSPQMARTDLSGNEEYFVAPTLGDTWMFDHDTKTWNRVELLGKGYNGAVSGTTFPNEFEKRQAYDATDSASSTAGLNALAPPALSGAMMVARTFPQSLKNASTTVTPLAIPQIYVFGGRTKDGKTLGFDNVYKFCAGSTGERWGSVNDTTNTDLQNVSDANDDASCDAFSASSSNSNTRSQSPVSEFKGRWLKKNPSGAVAGTNYPNADTLFEDTTQFTNGANLHAYLGAAAYDPIRDKIAVYGGVGNSTTSTATSITANTRAASSTITTTENVYEYTFPTKSNTAATAYLQHGYWSKISYCTWTDASGHATNTNTDDDYSDLPKPRHGHTLTFDQLNKQLVVVGGYSKTGKLLTQENSANALGTTYDTPEVWTAQRIDSVEEFPSGYTNTASPFVPCYFWKKKTTFLNSTQIAAQIPPSTALGYTAAVYIPATGYNTGYYTFQDQSCAKAGPVASSDPAVSKLNAGGVYIDLDRNELGARESVLLNLTYIPLGTQNNRPDGTPLTVGEEAVIKVHLMKTGQSRGQLQMTYQPRYLMYAASDQFPKTVQTLSVLSPANGEARTDQVLIPLGIDSGIDRIRIERYSGSAILIDAGLYRMGGE